MKFEQLKECDLEWARLLHNDPEVLNMLTDPRWVSSEQQASWFKRLVETASSERLVVKLDDDTKIGVIRLDHIDDSNKSMCVGLDIHEGFRGKGYAKKIYRHIFEEWFGGRGYNRLWLLVAEYNTRAINLYVDLGFVSEGVQREALYRYGKYHDYIMMSILREEWRAKWRTK